MTLLEDIQALLERTYATTGIQLGSFVIGPQRFHDLSALAGDHTREMSEAGRTFLRILDGDLLLAIYYSNHVIQELEKQNPKQTLNERNIRPFIVFVEEITHAVHAALRFLEGHREMSDEDFARDLELQAKVDTYLVLQFFVGSLTRRRRLSDEERDWLRHHLFETERFDYNDPTLSERYRETNHLGATYTRMLDGFKPSERVREIRRFRRLPYSEKRRHIFQSGVANSRHRGNCGRPEP